VNEKSIREKKTVAANARTAPPEKIKNENNSVIKKGIGIAFFPPFIKLFNCIKETIIKNEHRKLTSPKDNTMFSHCIKLNGINISGINNSCTLTGSDRGFRDFLNEKNRMNVSAERMMNKIK